MEVSLLNTSVRAWRIRIHAEELVYAVLCGYASLMNCLLFLKYRSLSSGEAK